MPPRFDVADFEKMAKVAEREADQAEAGSSTKARWTQIANAWRLIAERTTVERTEDSDSEADDAMRYQLSFYTLH